MGKADCDDLSLKQEQLVMYIDVNVLIHFVCFLVLILFRFSVSNISCDSGSFCCYCHCCCFNLNLGSRGTDTYYSMSHGDIGFSQISLAAMISFAVVLGSFGFFCFII